MTGRPDIPPGDAAIERAAAAVVRGDAPLDNPAAAEVHAAWHGIEALRDDPRMLAWRREALWAGGGWQVPRFVIMALSAAAVLIAGALIGHEAGFDPQAIVESLHPRAEHQAYRTGVGQRAVVTLEDGSVVTLDADSEVDVAFPDERRLVHLERGHAYFEVAHDKTRPFIVSAMGKTVTALGTAFGVSLDARTFAVVLVEGSVKVASASAPATRSARFGASVVLRPGMKLVAAGDGWTVASADINKEIGWTKGQLVFDDEPLASAVAQMNRYSRRPIRLADGTLGDRRISGVFPMGNPSLFARGLQSYGLVRIVKDAPTEIVLR